MHSLWSTQRSSLGAAAGICVLFAVGVSDHFVQIVEAYCRVIDGHSLQVLNQTAEPYLVCDAVVEQWRQKTRCIDPGKRKSQILCRLVLPDPTQADFLEDLMASGCRLIGRSPADWVRTFRHEKVIATGNAMREAIEGVSAPKPCQVMTSGERLADRIAKNGEIEQISLDTTAGWTLPAIIAQLDKHRQRASYGAVGQQGTPPNRSIQNASGKSASVPAALSTMQTNSGTGSQIERRTSGASRIFQHRAMRCTCMVRTHLTHLMPRRDEDNSSAFVGYRNSRRETDLPYVMRSRLLIAHGEPTIPIQPFRCVPVRRWRHN
jgi:hypothetical protein